MNIDISEILITKLSETFQPIIANVENIIKSDPVASPLNPSIMFIELQIPEIAKPVNIKDIK